MAPNARNAHCAPPHRYSGLTGGEMHADIFVGVVYYHRLRHMISDKSQVRSVGANNALTRQPIKGRKKHGGIRFGEMERDALIAHGTSFLLHDRLFNCSDKHTAMVCSQCGSILGPTLRPSSMGKGMEKDADGVRSMFWCELCKSGEHVGVANLPYVFRYLACELAGMNIKLSVDTEEAGLIKT